MNYGSNPMLDGGQSYGDFEDESVFDPPSACRVCGCTEHNACRMEDDGPCWWVEDDLCSACAPKGRLVEPVTVAQMNQYLREHTA